VPSFSEDQLTAIRTAIARGERSVTFSDRTVTYRSMDELLAAEARILSDMARASQRPRQYIGVASKGFGE
jgi:hypothetical protein